MCINSSRYVCCGECYVVSNVCDEPTSCLVQPIVAHWCEVMFYGCVGFRGELVFLNCDDVCMCVVTKQFELFEFVLSPFMLTLLLLGLCACVVLVVLRCVGAWVVHVVQVSSTGDVLAMTVVRDVGGVCDMCMCLARGSVGGEGCEWRRGWCLGFANHVGTGRVFNVCLCFGFSGVGSVGGQWVGGLDQGREGCGGVMCV